MLTRSRSQFTFSKALWTSIGVLLVTVIFGVVNAAAGYSDIRREAEDSCNEFYQSNIYFAYNAAASESLEVGFDSPIVEGYITFPVTVATGGTYYVWVRLRTTSVNADNTIEVDVNNASVSVFVVT